MTAPTPSGAARAAFQLAAGACRSHPRCPRQHGTGLRVVRRLIVELGRRREAQPVRAQPVRAAHTA